MKKTFFFYRTAFALVASALILLSACNDKKSSALEATSGEDEIAAPFVLKTLDDREFSLERHIGSPVVINFWASWCGPCRLEAGELQNAYMNYRGRGVQFIGVAVDDTREGAEKFIKEFGLTFPSGLDQNGTIARAYKIYGVPMTFVVQRDGRLGYIHVGTITGEILNKEIKDAL
jgi:peroxiredoxin